MSNLPPGYKDRDTDNDHNPRHQIYRGGAYRKAREKVTGSTHGQVAPKDYYKFKSTRRKIEKNIKHEALKSKMK